MNRTAMFVMRMAGLAVVAAAVAGSPAWAKNNRDVETSRATITLRVYDYAQVKPATLTAAEREASRILAQAGGNFAGLGGDDVLLAGKKSRILRACQSNGLLEG